MLYYQFKNYEGFKELFGVRECGNGTKTRRNKVLLSYIKNPKWLKMKHATDDALDDFGLRQMNITNMNDLWLMLERRIRWECDTLCNSYPIDLLGNWSVWSQQYKLDEYHGICEDGDRGSIRYVRVDTGRVYKKKAGRFLHDILMEYDFGKELDEAVMKWFCEEFTQRWHTLVASKMPDYELHVGSDLDDFERIYTEDECEGDFGSCMVNDGYYGFYKYAVDARAAYLTNKDGLIVARCVIYDKCHLMDGTNRVVRLAERQYSTDCDDLLKRVLVDKLIEAGEIDGYKKVGADCHSPNMFIWNNGDTLNCDMWIPCDLDEDDDVSYQDSFKWYDMDARKAYNFEAGGADAELDVTDGRMEIEENYDDYHSEYTRNDTVTVIYRGNEIQCDEERLDDFRWSNSEDIYIHEDEAVYVEDADDYIHENDAYYSDVLEQYFKYSSNLDDAEREYYENEGYVYSEHDNEWFENAEDVVTFVRLSGYRETIYKGTLVSFYDFEYNEEEDVYYQK